MNGTQLRNSILQYAIQGKLVPQDPNEESVSKLLKRVRDEKERLVEEKKIKKNELVEKPISDYEIPFEIPKGWVWKRMSDVLDVRDGTHDTPKYVSKGYPLVTSKNLKNNTIDFSTALFISENDYVSISQRSAVDNNDILYAMIGTIGNPVLVKKDRPFAIKNVALFKSIKNGMFMPYVYWFLNWQQGSMKEYASGGVQSFVSLKYLRNYCIPIPPLAEQKRIVAKLEEILPLVESYDKAQQKLDELNKALPDRLRKSILQEAIQGKLVEQDPSDEPASVLLERIREEKQKLVKAKVIKADKNESTIYCGEDGLWYEKVGKNEPVCIDEEIPFLIPKMWTWCRLKTIATKLVDGDHNPPSGVSYTTEYLMLSSKNINKDKLVNLNDVRYLTEDVFRKEDERTSAKLGDILFTSVGSLGRSCILNEKLNLCFQRSVSVITTLIVNHYLKRCLDSPFIQSFINDRATGTAQRGFYLNQLEQLLIPIPPLAEQKRIVAKLDELLKHIK